jgi:hypothetical protein
MILSDGHNWRAQRTYQALALSGEPLEHVLFLTWA